MSAWPLAKAVSKAGQLGVVAGTCLDAVLARRLQLGDPGEHMRRALAHFPLRDVARRIVDRYFVPGGKAPDAPFKANPVMTLDASRHAQDLAVAGNFAEVFLAREGHDHPVGINYLEKVQLPTLPSLFGAMLAGVGFVLMGAGIPKAIPGILDDLAAGQAAELRVDVKDARPGEAFHTRFDPAAYCGTAAPRLERPRFLAIIASAPLARMMAKKASGRVDGFVVEGPTAGGHNAPPRGGAHPGTTGEPVYGERDAPDLEAIASLGLPFWLAGSYGGPRRLVRALELGAAGIQVGTAFAWCEESGIPTETKARVLALSRRGEVRVLTDAVASPTGFPFKVVQLPGTLSAREHVRGPAPRLRPRLPALRLPPGERSLGVALPRRARGGLRPQGGCSRGHRGAQVHLQRAHEQHRPGPDPQARGPRGPDRDVGQRPARGGPLPRARRHHVPRRGRDPAPADGAERAGASGRARRDVRLVCWVTSSLA